MRYAIAALLASIVIMAGCSQSQTPPGNEVQEAPSVTAPPANEQEEALVIVQDDFIDEEETVDIGSMI